MPSPHPAVPPAPAHPAAVRRRAWALVTLGVLGVSLAAPLSAATAAPALAVAFWRTALGTLATAPFTLTRHRGELRALSARTVRACVLSGALLALHFALWVPSLRMTSVAASTALVCTTPVWTVAIARLRREAVPRGVVLGVALAMTGVLLITGTDAGRSLTSLTGDLLALAGGMAAAGYVVEGSQVRQEASTAVYTALAYGSCALLLVPVCVVAGADLAGYESRTWVELVVLTIAAQLIGHSALNAAVPVVGPTPLALAILFEVPGATLIAWAWLGQVPPATVVPGAALVLAGLGLVVHVTHGPVRVPDGAG